MTPSKQRKKTDKEESSKIRSRTTDGDEKISLTEQLDRAQSAVERNHAATLTLHQQWRTQLLRMSYLVMIVTMHMAQTPSGACIKEIKVTKKIATQCRLPKKCVSDACSILATTFQTIFLLLEMEWTAAGYSQNSRLGSYCSYSS